MILETDTHSTESNFKLSNRTNLNTVKTLFKIYSRTTQPPIERWGFFNMKCIETFFNIWNCKYPHLAGRINCTINTERLECGSFSSELTFEFHDDNGDEGLYYKMSYLVKMVFGSSIVASYTHDLNGLFLHQFHVKLT